MPPVEMIAKAINFLSTILVSAGLAVGDTETGAAMMELTLTVGNLLLGASGSSSAIDKGASKTTAAAARIIHFKGAPWHGSAGKSGLRADGSWPHWELPDRADSRVFGKPEISNPKRNRKLVIRVTAAFHLYAVKLAVGGLFDGFGSVCHRRCVHGPRSVPRFL